MSGGQGSFIVSFRYPVISSLMSPATMGFVPLVLSFLQNNQLVLVSIISFLIDMTERKTNCLVV